MDKNSNKNSRDKNLLIITQVVDETDPIMNFFIDWIEEFSRYYDKIFVICQREGKHDLPSNVEVLSLGKEKNHSRIIRILLFYKYIWELRNKYNKIFIHMTPIYVLLGSLVWKLFNKKIYLWYAHGILNKSLILSFPFVKKIFTPNKEGCKINSDKIIITGHGINTDLFRFNKNIKYNNDIINALVVGRISRIKNIETIIKAIKELNYNKKQIFLKIIGDSYFNDKDYKEELIKMVNNLKLKKYIRFIGWRDHKIISRYYKRCDLVISACLTSSFDKNILESMACGVPVITSNKSFKVILSDKFIFKEKNVKDLSFKIKEFIIMSEKDKRNLSYRLSKYVKYNNNLKNLINNISDMM